MSLSLSSKSRLRPTVAVYPILAALIILFLLPLTYHPHNHALHPTVRIPSHHSPEQHDTKIGIPFGHTTPTHNFTAPHRSLKPLKKRAIDYDRMVCKGRKLLHMIQTAQPVDYTWDEAALKNGWTWKRNVLGAPPEELLGALGKLGIATDERSVHSIYLKQDRVFMDKFGRLNNPPTGGLYHNTFIPSHGTIIAESNFSPSFKSPGSTIPPLSRWSDIIYLLWRHEAGLLNLRNLRYIFRSNIITPLTRDLIEYIEVSDENDLHLPWPGHTYDMNSEDGLALLATAHGQGVAYLIADHNDVLGRKIPMARVFTELPGGMTDIDAGSVRYMDDDGSLASDDGSEAMDISDDDDDDDGALQSADARGGGIGNSEGAMESDDTMDTSGGGSAEGALESDDTTMSEGGDSWGWGDATYYYILWELRDSITG
ncbi:MAG: hypothetical protein Q9169_006883 [Polycauliona sp. 2 TL-2023]